MEPGRENHGGSENSDDTPFSKSEKRAQREAALTAAGPLTYGYDFKIERIWILYHSKVFPLALQPQPHTKHIKFAYGSNPIPSPAASLSAASPTVAQPSPNVAQPSDDGAGYTFDEIYNDAYYKDEPEEGPASSLAERFPQFATTSSQRVASVLHDKHDDLEQSLEISGQDQQVLACHNLLFPNYKYWLILNILEPNQDQD